MSAAAPSPTSLPARHSLPTILIHWIQAGLVLGLLGLGWYLSDLPKGPDRSAAITVHKSLGLCAFALIFVRLGWYWLGPRLGRLHPAPLDGRPAEQALARWAHRLLYVFLLVAPLTGFLSASFTHYTMKFFGLELPRLFAPDDDLNLLFNTFHHLSTKTLAVLIGLHLAGALVHLLRREKIMARMLPHG